MSFRSWNSFWDTCQKFQWSLFVWSNKLFQCLSADKMSSWIILKAKNWKPPDVEKNFRVVYFLSVYPDFSEWSLTWLLAEPSTPQPWWDRMPSVCEMGGECLWKGTFETQGVLSLRKDTVEWDEFPPSSALEATLAYSACFDFSFFSIPNWNS